MNNTSKLTALAKRCRRDGRGVPDEIKNAVREAKQVLDKLQTIKRLAEMPLAGLRHELEPPEGLRPFVVFDCGQSHFYFVDEDDEPVGEASWPFDRSYIFPDDCDFLGIEWTVA